MKILAIGNSFSQDATKYLQSVAKSAGEDLFVRNIYIGGCSLERHALNIKTGEAAYGYEEDAQKIVFGIYKKGQFKFRYIIDKNECRIAMEKGKLIGGRVQK